RKQPRHGQPGPFQYEPRGPGWWLTRETSEGDPQGRHHIVMDHWIGCHRDLVPGTENQVGWPGSGDVADLEAPEDDAGREHHLVQPGMYSVRPDFVIDLQLRPEIAQKMILEGRIPEKWIAEITERRAGLGLWAD